jgi:hypothetical protein
MQPNLSGIPLGPRQPPWRTSEPTKLWLEEEKLEEVEEIEKQKKETESA